MKKILVLTDLSDNSGILAGSGLALAAKLKADLILLHTWATQPVLTEYTNSNWATDTLMYGERCKRQLDGLIEDMELRIKDIPIHEHCPSLDWVQEDQSLPDCLQKHEKKGDIELVVMGARSGSALDHLMMGSDTSSVINRSDRPVLVIPKNKSLKQLKKVTFATDFDDADINAVQYLTHIGRKLNFQLNIVHVTLYGHQDKKLAEKKKHFETVVAGFNYPHISYITIAGKSLADRLTDFCLENESDLLALCHDHQKAWDRFFKASASDRLMKAQALPLMVIPATLKKI